jgi:NTE family protein
MATAIVTAGAGARGAYEAGVLSVALPTLLAEGERNIVLVGTSAGALNTAIVAGAAQPGGDPTGKLRHAWFTLDVDQVFTLNWRSILASGIDFVFKRALHNYALFNTHPLRKTVTTGGAVTWSTFNQNFEDSSWLKVAGVVATQASSGRSTVFVQGMGNELPQNNQARGIDYVNASLGPGHVLGSAAIPFLFPSESVDGHGWFMDGGVRLNTPIAPAVDILTKLWPNEPKPHRILIVSTDPDPPPGTTPNGSGAASRTTARAIAAGQPDIIDEGATIMYSMFVDRVAEDVLSLRRVNAIVAASAGTPTGVPGHLAKVKDMRVGNRAGQPFQTIDHCYVGPTSRGQIAGAAGRAFASHQKSWSGSMFARRRLDVVSRALANRGQSHDEILSFILFDKGFLKELFEMGEGHAKSVLKSGIPWRS